MATGYEVQMYADIKKIAKHLDEISVSLSLLAALEASRDGFSGEDVKEAFKRAGLQR